MVQGIVLNCFKVSLTAMSHSTHKAQEESQHSLCSLPSKHVKTPRYRGPQGANRKLQIPVETVVWQFELTFHRWRPQVSASLPFLCHSSSLSAYNDQRDRLAPECAAAVVTFDCNLPSLCACLRETLPSIAHYKGDTQPTTPVLRREQTNAFPASPHCRPLKRLGCILKLGCPLPACLSTC